MPQIKYQALQHPTRTVLALIQVAVLLCVSVIPLLMPSQAGALQITSRKITLTSSVASASTTHAVSFQPAQTTNILGIVVDYCTSPIVGIACTHPSGMTTPSPAATVNVSHNGQNNVAFTVHANSSTSGLVILTHATGMTSVSTGAALTFSMTVTNPSTSCGGSPADKCTFYARILTYSSTAGAAAYTAASPGSHIDDGGVALSTANQLTVSARVQEVLHFCVGTTDAASADDCSDISGTAVDLGVVDNTAVSISPVVGGNNKAGLAMVRTNAVNGVVIGYFAVQDTGSGNLGALRVAGSTCTSANNDPCFNSKGTTGGAIVAGTENFGMTASSVDTSNGSTTVLTRDAQYAGNGTAGSLWAWDETGTFDTVATSSSAVDDEMLNLKFAATANSTTPTGAYSVTSTFIATATF